MTKHAAKITNKGTELPVMDLKGKPYMQVAYRLVWFREDHPDGCISTEAIQVTESYAVFKATISIKISDNSYRVVATGHKREYLESFADFIEKAETGAIGRALAASGFGTQFEPELDEGERIVDSPVAVPQKQNIAPIKKELASIPTPVIVNLPTVEEIAVKGTLKARVEILLLKQLITSQGVKQKYLLPVGVGRIDNLDFEKAKLVLKKLDEDYPITKEG